MRVSACNFYAINRKKNVYVKVSGRQKCRLWHFVVRVEGKSFLVVFFPFKVLKFYKVVSSSSSSKIQVGAVGVGYGVALSLSFPIGPGNLPLNPPRPVRITFSA